MECRKYGTGDKRLRIFRVAWFSSIEFGVRLLARPQPVVTGLAPIEVCAMRSIN